MSGAGIVQPDVTVAWSHTLDPREIGSDRKRAVGRKCIDRFGQRSRFSGIEILDATNVGFVLPIVPDNFAFRTWSPLQHAALLPTPGLTGSQFDPAILVAGIHNADLDLVFGCWCPVFKADLVGENQSVGYIEFLFVIVPKPVVVGTSGDGPNRGRGRSIKKARRRGAGLIYISGTGDHADRGPP